MHSGDKIQPEKNVHFNDESGNTQL